jgi:hypothetical protein
MTTGLFPIRRRESGVRPRQRPRETVVDQFAEALSRHDLATGDEGGDVRKAAAAIGKTYSHGRQMLGMIRRAIGWQAQ